MRPTVQQLEGRDTPSTLQVVVNDGSAQRSMVTGLTVNFNQAVRFAGGTENATAAFALRGPNGPMALTVDLSGSTPQQTVARLTPVGPGVTAGSLDDGDYTLDVQGGMIRDAAGNPIDAGGPTAFHRLFGDSDGDRDVDATDLFNMKATFGQTAADPYFRFAFDADADGDVDGVDLFAFHQRFGTALAPKAG